MCGKQVRQCPEWAISCEWDVKRVDHKLAADSDDCPYNNVAIARVNFPNASSNCQLRYFILHQKYVYIGNYVNSLDYKDQSSSSSSLSRLFPIIWGQSAQCVIFSHSFLLVIISALTLILHIIHPQSQVTKFIIISLCTFHCRAGPKEGVWGANYQHRKVSTITLSSFSIKAQYTSTSFQSFLIC